MKLVKRFIGYWIIAVLFAVVFGEVITGIISSNPTFFQAATPITIYYIILSFIFGIIITKTKTIYYLTLFFVYGATSELFLFRNIKGISDIVGILFFGFFYIFLFGTPWLIAKRVWEE